MNQDHFLTCNMILPPEVMQALGDYLLEKIKPIIAGMPKKDHDTIFDVRGLAAYLNVDENWIYQRTRKQQIPFIKKGKYCMFRKAVIDAWLDQDAVKPLSPFSSKKK